MKNESAADSVVIEAAERFLTPADIESKDDTTYDVIDVPEWGGKIRVGTLNASDLIEYVEANNKDRRTAAARLIAKSMVDGDGKRIGTTRFVETLQTKNAAVLTRITSQIIKLNGLEEATQAAIKEMAKNDSGAADTGASPTA